ncbi:sigma 54-interacting transcriptional regulator [Clostridium frigidicarnis]|uniref:Transcriptional regulator containing PAS, AAA-type ATPase, and DNA-binding Fis domains n=1 Tax=Clostridium frigidicarnis TaxID=84698 RepID=A0A1I0VM43_9CLOT|nr:sigma 54-interacting transcriptional regulator [Clostridium frigidicarnis]SFA76656.1 Transcriptional regulator containing PAS, AAA-type ATPase, and DNA-binding Fis domains [Clostridium frigidicarnis]
MAFCKNILENIMDKLCEGIIVIDIKGKIINANNECKRLFHKDKIEEMNIKSIINDMKINDVFRGEYIISSKKIVTLNKSLDMYAIPFKDEDKRKAVLLFKYYNDVNNCKGLDDEDNIRNIDILNTIMNSADERVVIIDKNGVITMMSNSYKEFIGCDDPEGKHVRKVIENTKLHNILETGKVEVGDIQEIKGKQMISMRFPIKKDGQVIGAIGKVMFKDISDLYKLNKKIDLMQKELEFYKNEFSNKRKALYSIDDIIGKSEKIMQIKLLSRKIANTNSNVLIVGESGTGKELFAHSIHNLSNRYLGAFIKINCAAIPSELLESELFGYEGGAFTGANKKGKKGKFELANEGTIFLDEIGDMPLTMQGKLLRVIQEKEVERLGGNELKKIDVRIIAATNKNLEELVRKGEFREDLYYRLNVMKITVPALKDRKDDIESLCEILISKVSKRLGIYVEGISEEAVGYLITYNWPGNIRELENVIERAINLLDSDLIIKVKHLPMRITENEKKYNYKKDRYLKEVIEEVEENIIRDCLIKNNGNKNRTAKILGISRAGLYKKIDEYNLQNY